MWRINCTLVKLDRPRVIGDVGVNEEKEEEKTREGGKSHRDAILGVPDLYCISFLHGDLDVY